MTPQLLGCGQAGQLTIYKMSIIFLYLWLQDRLTKVQKMLSVLVWLNTTRTGKHTVVSEAT